MHQPTRKYKDSIRYDSGRVEISRQAFTNPEELALDITATQGGFVEVYVYNASSLPVWYDQFSISSSQAVIIQENHYYPFGMQIAGLELDLDSKNRYLYQGKELQEDHDLNTLDFHARMYDPAIGRTFQMDPMADSYYPWSPYAWVMNNPLKFIDPTGMFADYYDSDGNYLGNDGVDDEEVYQTTSYNIDYQTDEDGETDWEGVKRNSTYLGEISEAFQTWDPVTNDRITGLHPAVRMKATNFIKETEENLGIRLRISTGFRSDSEQDALYMQSRDGSGRPWATNARAGQSYHNYGLAIDVVEILNGSAKWDTNWDGISQIGKGQGFSWGGDWSKSKDKPHFEMSFGNTTQALSKMPLSNGGYLKLKK